MRINWVGWRVLVKSGTMFLILLILTLHPTEAQTTTYKFCYYDDPLNSFPSSCEFASQVKSPVYDCNPVFDGYQCFKVDINSNKDICGLEGKTINDFTLSIDGRCSNPSICMEGPRSRYLENKTSIFPENHFELYCTKDPVTGVGRVTKCNIGTNFNINDPNNMCAPFIQSTNPFTGERPDCSTKTPVDAGALYGIKSVTNNNSMNPDAASSLTKVKEEVIRRTGRDIFNSLGEILRNPNFVSDNPGVAYKSWHKAGRAIDFNQNLKNATNFKVEPEGNKFRIIMQGYNNENVDLTEIMERNGWFRIPANEGVEEWWHYQYHPDNISWENAMFQFWPLPTLLSAFQDVDWVSVSQNCTTGNYSYGNNNDKPCSLTGNFYEDIKPNKPLRKDEKVKEEDFTCENPSTCIEQNIFSQENGRKPRAVFCVDDDAGKGHKFLCPETSKGDPRSGFKLTTLDSYKNLFAPASNRNGALPPASKYLSGIPGKYQGTNLRYCSKLYDLMRTYDVTKITQKETLGYTGILASISQLIFSASAFLFILLIIINGIKYVRSAGDPTELKKAGQGLFNTIAGFLFIVFAGGFIINLIRLLKNM